MKRQRLEEAAAAYLTESGLTISVAESCTGGLICHRITDVPGSSRYFIGGIVAYSNEIKKNKLGVSEETLKRFGAVHGNTAAEMARGARKRFKSNIGISSTGIAGPSGGSSAKPVGTVFIAVSDGVRETVSRFLFKGSRTEIKLKTSDAALNLLVDFLTEHYEANVTHFHCNRTSGRDFRRNRKDSE